jgi:hypothetical protein
LAQWRRLKVVVSIEHIETLGLVGLAVAPLSSFESLSFCSDRLTGCGRKPTFRYPPNPGHELGCRAIQKAEWLLLEHPDIQIGGRE